MIVLQSFMHPALRSFVIDFREKPLVGLRGFPGRWPARASVVFARNVSSGDRCFGKIKMHYSRSVSVL